jgi:hypothetical protein
MRLRQEDPASVSPLKLKMVGANGGLIPTCSDCDRDDCQAKFVNREGRVSGRPSSHWRATDSVGARYRAILCVRRTSPHDRFPRRETWRRAIALAIRRSRQSTRGARSDPPERRRPDRGLRRACDGRDEHRAGTNADCRSHEEGGISGGLSKRAEASASGQTQRHRLSIGITGLPAIAFARGALRTARSQCLQGGVRRPIVRRLVCHGTNSGGWLLLTRGAIVLAVTA